MTRTSKDHAARTCSPRILAFLRDAGTAGAFSADIARVLGMSAENAATHLARAVTAGTVAIWKSPIGKCTNRKHYWLTEFRPASPPPRPPRSADLTDVSVQTTGLAWRGLSKTTDAHGRKVTKAPPLPDHRYAVELPAGYVSTLDPGECRPWAKAVA